MMMMGVDSSTDVQDFEEFLQDEIFVDYFNTFLSLPVRNCIDTLFILVHKLNKFCLPSMLNQ